MPLNEFGDNVFELPVPQDHTVGVNEFGDPVTSEPLPKPTAQDRVVAGQGTPPEAAAQAKTLAEKTSVPAQVIKDDPKPYQEQVDRQDAINAVNTNDALNAWVAQDPMAAMIAAGDFGQLDKVTRTLQHFNSSVNKDFKDIWGDTLKTIQLIPSRFAAGMRGEAPDFQEAIDDMKKFGATDEEALRLASRLQVRKEIQDTIFAPVSLAIAYPMAYYRTLISRPFEEATGLPKEVNEFFFGAFLAAAGLVKGSKAVDVPSPFRRSNAADIGNFLDTAARYQERGRTTWQEMQDFMRPKVEPQKLLEGPKEPTDLITEAAKPTKAVEEKVPEVDRPPEEERPPEKEAEKPTEEISPAREIEPVVPPVGDVPRTFLAHGEVPRAGDDFLMDRAHVEQHALDAAAFDQAFRQIQEAKTKELSPKALQDLIAIAAPDQNVYIPAETVARLYHDSEPVQGDKILGWADRAEEKIPTALQTHSDLVVPAAEFLAHAPEAIYNQIKDQIGFRNTGVTNEVADEIGEKTLDNYDKPEYQVDPDFVKFLQDNAPDWLKPSEGYVPDLTDAQKAAHELQSSAQRRKVQTTAGISREGVVDILGASRYGDLTDMHRLVVKELFQNAKDAVSNAIKSGVVTEGKITIEADEKQNLTRVTDNGMGMTAEILSGPFLAVASSAEKDAGTGGFGIAKMVTLYTAQKVNVKTLRDGQYSELSVTGKDIETSAKRDTPLPDGAVTTGPATDKEMRLFPEGHGTIVEIITPTTWLDPSEMEQKPVWFRDYSFAHAGLVGSPMFEPTEVTFKTVGPVSKEVDEQVLPIGKNFPIDKYVPVFRAKFGWGDATLLRSKDPINLKTRYDVEKSGWIDGKNLSVLSRGLWQFSTNIPANPNEMYGDPIPYNFYLDIDPKVKPRQVGYPFDLDRQGFTRSAQTDANKIVNFISMLWQQQEFATAVKHMGTISYLTPEGATEAKPLEPKVPQGKESPLTFFDPGDNIEVKPGKPGQAPKLFVRGKEIPDFDADKMKKEGRINIDELTIDDKLIDKTRPLLHSNMKVDPSRVGGEALGQALVKELLERKKVAPPKVDVNVLGKQKFGKRWDDFNLAIGQMFFELRDAVAEVIGLDYAGEEQKMKDWAIGVSYDITYRGVSTILPFRAAYLNPAGVRYADPIMAATGIWGTAVHELAHVFERNHGPEFTATQQDFLLRLEAVEILMLEGLSRGKTLTTGGKDAYSPVRVKTELARFFRKNEDILKFATSAINADAEPIGRRFKDPDAKSEERDVGPAPVMEGLEPTGDERGPPTPGAGAVPGVPGEPGGGPEGPKTALGEAVKRERKALYVDSIFAGPPPGVDKVTFARFSKRIAEQDSVTDEKALEKAKKIVAARKTPEWRQNKEEMMKEVETDMKSSPAIIADRAIRTGDLPSGDKIEPQRLDAEAVKRLGGKNLGRYTTDKRGKDPEDVAGMLQFKNGKDLIDTLNTHEAERAAYGKGSNAFLAHLIRQETDKRMEEKYGSLKENILKEARVMATASDKISLLTDQLKILSDLLGQKPLTKEDIISDVEDKFQRMVAQDVSYELFRRGAASAAKVAIKAASGKNWREAFTALLHQSRATIMAREALGYDDKRDAMEKRFRKIANGTPKGSLEYQEYVNHAKKILNDIGFSGNPPDRAPEIPLPDLIDGSQGSMAVAPWLYDTSQRRAGMDYKNLTVEEMDALDKSLRSILHAGRTAEEISSAHTTATRTNVIMDIEKELQRFGERPPWNKQSYVRRALSLINKVQGAHVLVERIFDYTDKFNPEGPISSYVDRPLRDGYNKELMLTERVRNRLRKLEEYVDNSINDYIPNDAIIDPLDGKPYNVTRQNLRNIMLHMGSKSGLEKATKGYNVTGSQLFEMVRKNATAADVAWVNGMHELFDYLWGESAEMQRRYTGVEADKVEGLPYSFYRDNVEYKLNGGYAPLFYDKSRPTVDAKGNLTPTVEGLMLMRGDLFEPTYVAAIPAHSYTLPRTKYAGWIDMNGTLMATKIQQMVHDIAFREPVRNAQKVIADPKFMLAMNKYWGEQYASLLPGWIHDIANVQNVDDSYAQGFAHAMALARKGIVNTLIWLNPRTAGKHFGSAAAMSYGQTVGPKALDIFKTQWGVGIKGMWGAAKDLATSRDELPSPDLRDNLRDIMTKPGTREFIIENSPLFRSRSLKYPDSIRGAWERASSFDYVGRQRARTLAEKNEAVGRFLVALSDFVSAGPQWMATFKDTLVRTGDVNEARYEADRAMTRAHGSMFIGDRPRVMRVGTGVTGELARNFIQLFTFWNHAQNNLFQLMWDIQARTTRGAGSEPGADWGSIIQRIFLLSLVPLIMEEVMMPVYSDKKHGGWGWSALMATIRFAGGMWPGVREITNAAAGGYEPTVGMIGYAYNLLFKLGHDVVKGGRNWIIDVFTVLGALGFGGAQAGKTVQGVTRWRQGRERPRNIQEKATLLTQGRTRLRR